MRYFYQAAGKIHAILNSRRRRSDADRMVTMPLDSQELKLYTELKDAGKTDSTIFKELFPPRLEPPKPVTEQKITLTLNELNKRQLVHLIMRELNVDLPSLPKMSVADLRQLYRAIKSP